MCIDAHISSSTSQTLVFSVGDVFLGLWVNVFFCQTKVYDVDGVLPFGARSAHQEVLRLHISIDQASGMDKLHTGYLWGNKHKARNLVLNYNVFEENSICVFVLPVVWLSLVQSLERKCGHRGQRDLLGWVPVAPEP